MIPIRSWIRLLDYESAVVLSFFKGSIFEHVHLVHTASLVMGRFQYLASLDLVVRPISEQTLGVLTPFWVLMKPAWGKRVYFAVINVEIHPWPWR